MNTDEKLDHLAGSVDGLLCFVMAVMQTHQNLQELNAKMSEYTEKQTVFSLASTASDRFVEGQAQMKERLKQLMLAALLSRQ